MDNNYTLTLLSLRENTDAEMEIALRDTGCNVNDYLKKALLGDSMIVYHKTGVSCREFVVSYMSGYYSRQYVAMEAGLVPVTVIDCKGSEDRKSGTALRESKQTVGLTRLLHQILGSRPTVKINPEDSITLKFSNESGANPLKVSLALLIIRMFRGLMEVDKEFTFLSNPSRLLQTVLSNMGKLKDIYQLDTYGMSRTNLLLAFSAMMGMDQVTGGSYTFLSNGPASYAYRLSRDNWKKVLSIAGENSKLYNHPDFRDIPNLQEAIKETK